MTEELGYYIRNRMSFHTRRQKMYIQELEDEVSKLIGWEFGLSVVESKLLQ